MNNVYDPDDCVSETGVVKCNEWIPAIVLTIIMNVD